MDIGNQQRVIIVEPEPVEAPEPVPAKVERATADLADEWPLPLLIDADPAPVR